MAGALAGVLLVASGSTSAASAAPNFTWTGLAPSEIESTDWSHPENWEGNVAPTNGSAIGTLTFAESSLSECSSNSYAKVQCYLSTDNLGHIEVNKLAFARWDWELKSLDMTLGAGGIEVASPNDHGAPSVSGALALSTSQTWQLSSGSIGVDNSSVLGGPGVKLTFAVNGGYGADFEGSDIEVGEVVIKGDGEVVLQREFRGAQTKKPSSLVTGPGYPISVESGARLTTDGAETGSIMVHEGALTVVQEALTVNGNVTLTPQAKFVGGLGGSMNATGTVNLAEATFESEGEYVPGAGAEECTGPFPVPVTYLSRQLANFLARSKVSRMAGLSLYLPEWAGATSQD